MKKLLKELEDELENIKGALKDMSTGFPFEDEIAMTKGEKLAVEEIILKVKKCIKTKEVVNISTSKEQVTTIYNIFEMVGMPDNEAEQNKIVDKCFTYQPNVHLHSAKENKYYVVQRKDFCCDGISSVRKVNPSDNEYDDVLYELYSLQYVKE